MDLIERPVYTPAELAAEAAVAAVPLPQLTAARRAELEKRRAEARLKDPAQLLLFTPAITLFPDNVSLIRWFSPDAAHGFAEMEVWLRGPDLETAGVAGDLDVKMSDGRTRRYLLMPSVVRATDRFASKRQPPSAGEFGGQGPGEGAGMAVILEKGSASDVLAMEPLTALLAAYTDPARAAKIAGDAAALKSRQAAEAEAEAREKAHPKVPEPTVIKFYTSDTDETSVLKRAAGGSTK